MKISASVFCLSMSFFNFLNADEVPAYLDNNGYWCLSNPSKGMTSACINIRDAGTDNDYQGEPVILVWEKFKSNKVTYDGAMKVDTIVYQMAIKCHPIEKDSWIQAIYYYQDAVQNSYILDKSQWAFQSEAPGTLQANFNNYVCNGKFLKDYAMINGISQS